LHGPLQQEPINEGPVLPCAALAPDVVARLPCSALALNAVARLPCSTLAPSPDNVANGRIHQPWWGELDKIAGALGWSAAAPEHL
jgi:hypothetical protein